MWTRLKSSFDSLTNQQIVLGSELFPLGTFGLILNKAFANYYTEVSPLSRPALASEGGVLRGPGSYFPGPYRNIRERKLEIVVYTWILTNVRMIRFLLLCFANLRGRSKLGPSFPFKIVFYFLQREFSTLSVTLILYNKTKCWNTVSPPRSLAH